MTFNPAPNANGPTAVTLTLVDAGGTANGGVDTSPSLTFNINVKPVNDAPILAGLQPNLTLNEGDPTPISLDDKASDVETASANVRWLATSSDPLAATATISPSRELVISALDDGAAFIQVTAR